jgi:hypothetical protein
MPPNYKVIEVEHEGISYTGHAVQYLERGEWYVSGVVPEIPEDEEDKWATVLAKICEKALDSKSKIV